MRQQQHENEECEGHEFVVGMRVEDDVEEDDGSAAQQENDLPEVRLVVIRLFNAEQRVSFENSTRKSGFSEQIKEN